MRCFEMKGRSMSRFLLLAGAALITGACDRGEAPAPPVQNEIVVRSDAQKRLFELNDLDRVIAFKRAMGEQGLRCAQMTRTGYVARYKDMDMWTATCSDDRQWAIFIGANDSVQVRLCDDNEKLGLPACKIQPGTEGGTGLEKLDGNTSG
jgi:hypothetical protein